MKGEIKDVLQELLLAAEAGKSVALATIVRAAGSTPRRAGAKMLVYDDGTIAGTIGGGEMESLVITEAVEALKDGKPRLIPYRLVDPAKGDPGICGGDLEIYVEPYTPPLTIFIIGGGHVGKAVAQLAKWLGFRVAITDDRPEFASPDHIPDADLHLPLPFAEALKQFTITTNTFVVAVTRNVKVDLEILPQLVATPAPYIGLIGSKRRWQEAQKLLVNAGMSQADLSRISSPIGLEIHAETPAEIAVSIMAEIITKK